MVLVFCKHFSDQYQETHRFELLESDLELFQESKRAVFFTILFVQNSIIDHFVFEHFQAINKYMCDY